MTSLASVPPVGINTDFIRDHPLELFVDSNFTGGTDTVTLGDGSPFMIIERDFMSASKRTHFTDARSDQKLFEMQKRTLGSEYYAEHPDGSGGHLFDIDIEGAFMGGPTAYVRFPNAANGGSPVQFEYKTHTFENVNIIVWDGQPVAEIEKHSLSRSRTIRIAPLVDPLPVVALLAACTERERRKRRQRNNHV